MATATTAGTIFSGPTSADAASVFWNPAAMTLLSGTQGMFFGAISFVRAHYQRDTVDSATRRPFPQADLSVPKPDVAPFVVTDAGLERFRFGVGLAIPVIDGASWELEYGGQPSSTRYFVVNARMAQFMIEPAAAVKVNRWLSIGVGLDIIAMWVTNTVMTDMSARLNELACNMGSILGQPPPRCDLDNELLPRENPNFDARTDVDGVGWSAGVYGGLLLTPVPSLRLGFSMHSGSIVMKVPVTMKVAIPPAVTDWVARQRIDVQLPDLTAEGEVEMRSPLIIKAGAAYRVTPRLELAADVQWIQKSVTAVMWGNIHRASSSLITSQVLPKDQTDDFNFGLRGAYQLSRPALRLALRFEYGPNTRPERFTTPVSLDFHKLSLHAGVAWQVHRHFALYLEYSHWFCLPRHIAVTNFNFNPNPTTPEEESFDRPSPTGDYSAETDRIGAGITFHY